MEAAAAAGQAAVAGAEDAAEAGLPLARRPPGRFLPGAAAALVFAFPPGRRAQPGGEDSGKWLPRKGWGSACGGKGGVRSAHRPTAHSRRLPGCRAEALFRSRSGREGAVAVAALVGVCSVAQAAACGVGEACERTLVALEGLCYKLGAPLCHGAVVGKQPPSSGWAAFLEAAGHFLLKCFY